MKHFTVKAKGTLLGILYTTSRVLVATEDAGEFLLHEYDRKAPGSPLSTSPHPSKTAVLAAMSDRQKARKREEAH